jgi:hypothetical protein
LKTVITLDGSATGIRVTRPLALGLDEQAIKAVRRWRFTPGLFQGRPAPVLTDVAVDFFLPSRQSRWHLVGVAFHPPDGASDLSQPLRRCIIPPAPELRAQQLMMRGSSTQWAVETPKGTLGPDPFPVFLLPHDRPIRRDTGMLNWMLFPGLHFELAIPRNAPDAAEIRKATEQINTNELSDESGAIIGAPRPS